MSEALDRTTAWDARKALFRRGVGASRLSVAAEGPPLRKACSAPTGRRFPSCSCRSPHPRPTQAHIASRHRTPLPRLTLERPQPRPAPSNRPGAGPVSERHITTPPSGETVPELRTRAGSPILTKLACKRFHKGGAGRSGAPGNRGCLIPNSGSHGTRRRPQGTKRCPFRCNAPSRGYGASSLGYRAPSLFPRVRFQ